jgi:hypothetical protein
MKVLRHAAGEAAARHVKFLPELAPVNLALTEGAVGAGAVDHQGVQVQSYPKV